MLCVAESRRFQTALRSAQSCISTPSPRRLAVPRKQNKNKERNLKIVSRIKNKILVDTGLADFYLERCKEFWELSNDTLTMSCP